MNFTSIKIEGGLISPEILEDIAEGRAQGQTSEDFGLDKNRRLVDEIGAVWADARVYWDAFQRSVARLPEGDPATSETRDQWVRPLLAALGYSDLTFFRKAADVGGQSYAISHRAGSSEDAPPVDIEGFRTSLDRRPQSGTPRISPHALVQEYLNRTESLWGIVTNGRVLRVLRDSPVLSRQTYIEFNLEQLMQSEGFPEFALFYRLLHRTRLPKLAEDAPECLLEKYHIETVKTGGRVRDKLRDGVEAAIRLVGSQLPLQPRNGDLAERLRSGELAPIQYYRQLLRFVYRLLFLMVGEERGLIGPSESDTSRYEVYHRFYSIRRLRDLAGRISTGSERQADLWQGLLVTFRLFSEDGEAEIFGMKALDGGLFGPESMPDLAGTHLPNACVLEVIRSLSMFEDEKNVRRRVNYGALDVEEFGSVYESLLDYHPSVIVNGDEVEFDLIFGSERKTTGSYYTPRELVQELIKSALVPVIEDRLKDKRTKQEKRDAILSISVCDPACGSGHFLLAAARRLGWELARVDTGEESPNPSDVRASTREVIRRCIYGVDLNPLAVDLCKVALWIEGHTPGKPLSFLDHRIKHGNSLVGLMPDMHGKPIPKEAYKPLSDDDKKAAAEARRRNEQALKSEQSDINNIFMAGQKIRSRYSEIARMPDDSPEQVHAKAKAWEDYEDSPEYRKEKLAADLWCAPFFWPYGNDGDAPTTADVMDTLAGWRKVGKRLRDEVEAMADEHTFFHWRLAFPDVFSKGGFDSVLGNPPWERIKLQEQEFFGHYDREIAQASSKAARQRLIDELPRKSPSLAMLFAKSKHSAEAQSKFVRESGRFTLTAVGDVNTYALFAEQFKEMLSGNGRAGVVVPTGIATDDSTKAFFGGISSGGLLASLFDFENRDAIFPGVHRSYKFCLLTLAGSPVPSGDFAFFLASTDQLRDDMRRFKLSADDIALLNPNTRTCPVFRTKADAELTRLEYHRIPILVREDPSRNPWGAVLRQGLFHLSNDLRDGNVYDRWSDTPRGPEVDVPLYEAKLIWQFDHRYATYPPIEVWRTDRDVSGVASGTKQDGSFVIAGRYYTTEQTMESRVPDDYQRQWFVTYRDIARSTDERTVIAACLPRLGIAYTLRLFSRLSSNSQHTACLLGCLNSIPLDFLARQSVASTHLSDYIVKQFPVLPPSAYCSSHLAFVLGRMQELVYTSWDVKPFADDVWREADDATRGAARGQWEANKTATGGHEWAPPEWAEIAEGGIPLPPFKWDDDRRAILRAELDAFYAKLYGLNRKQLRYILDPHGLSKKELEDILSDWEDPTCSGPHLLPAEPDLDFPGETFRVLKDKDEKQFGEYRTRRFVLEAWERLHAQGLMPEPYDQRKDPVMQAAMAQSRPQDMAADGGAPISDPSAPTEAEPEQRSGAGTQPPTMDLRLTPPPKPRAPKSRPGDSSQDALFNLVPGQSQEPLAIIPGKTKVLVAGSHATALSCEQVLYQGEPSLKWTVIRDDDGGKHTYYAPPGKVEVME